MQPLSKTHIMKLLLGILFTLGLAFNPLAQSIEADITNAFKSGNSGALAKNFTSSIDLVVNDNDDVYSSVQAEQILKKFFSDHKPTSFKIVHQGESRSGIKYFIGELQTSSGEFRVTINVKDLKSGAKIHQLRIE